MNLDSFSFFWQHGQVGLGQLLDLVLPPRCLACGEIAPEQGRVCPACWNQVPFLAGSRCRVCALPISTCHDDKPICEHCAFEPPVFEQAVAALRYEGLARKLILRFKHGDRIEGAALLAEWLVAVVRPLVMQPSLILPIPLHRWRILARGYNQSSLLARPLARQLGCDFQDDLLQRPVASRSQQGLNANQRQSNVQTNQFALKDPSTVIGRHVILVDDVLTTGSTFNACASLLMRAGAARVDVAALARVVHEEKASIS